MKSILFIVLGAFAALAFNGCAHHTGPHSAHLHLSTHAEYAQPSQIVCYGTGPWAYTVYYGSDEKYHYFEEHHHLVLERHKVPRTAMTYWKPVFPVGKGRLYVERNAQAELVAIPHGEKR